MSAILMFQNIVRNKLSHKTVSINHNFWSERRAEVDSNRGPSAYQSNALPLGQTGSQRNQDSGTFGDNGVYKHKTEPIFILDPTQSVDFEPGSTFQHTNMHIYVLTSV